jgi:nitrite reductase (NADH) small subunit
MNTINEHYIKVAMAADIPRGEGRIVETDGKEIALFHLESGDFRAVDNACPHRGGPLAHGILSGSSVICPLHGWKVSLDTGEVEGEEGRVAIYPVKVDNGEIRLGPINAGG